jgi:membrane protease YdiL (CAAX protease family)
VYPSQQVSFDLNDPMTVFKIRTDNAFFVKSPWTYVMLIILLVGYPALSLMGIGDDPNELLRSLNQDVLLFLLIFTIMFQWCLFLINYITVYFEGTGLAGVGVTRPRLLDFAWGISFFLCAWLLLTGLAWLMAKAGMPLAGEIDLLIPTTAFGRVIWVAVSFTAGFCEEIAFRGYLMTRLRILGRFNSWLVPTIISAVAFGICHAYQGIPGFILITIYGMLFSWLYIRTGRLWPCILAHFLQDFGALFLPR